MSRRQPVQDRGAQSQFVARYGLQVVPEVIILHDVSCNHVSEVLDAVETELPYGVDIAHWSCDRVCNPDGTSNGVRITIYTTVCPPGRVTVLAP